MVTRMSHVKTEYGEVDLRGFRAFLALVKVRGQKRDTHKESADNFWTHDKEG